MQIVNLLLSCETGDFLVPCGEEVMELRPIGAGLAAAILVAIVACGRLPDGSGATTSPQASSNPSLSPMPTPSTWPTYSDPDYRFSISYPPGFTVQRHPAGSGTGLLVSYRAVDPIYLNSYPPGQLEFVVYNKDANTLSDWVAKHSGPPGSADITRYWTPVSNQSSATVAGNAGLSFDWVPDMRDKIVHATVVFLGTAYVFLVQWWSTDPSYEATLRQDYAQMLNTVQV